MKYFVGPRWAATKQAWTTSFDLDLHILKLWESRIVAAVWFSVITDRIPEICHGKGHFFILALLLLGSGADLPSAFLCADCLYSSLMSAAWAAPPLLPTPSWCWARLLLHLLHYIIIFFIHFNAGKIVCSRDSFPQWLCKPLWMHTWKAYRIKSPEPFWPPHASPKHHKHLNESLLIWEKQTCPGSLQAKPHLRSFFLIKQDLRDLTSVGQLVAESSQGKEIPFLLTGPY